MEKILRLVMQENFRLFSNCRTLSWIFNLWWVQIFHEQKCCVWFPSSTLSLVQLLFKEPIGIIEGSLWKHIQQTPEQNLGKINKTEKIL